ncbi:hypothetical protein [Rhizobium sp. RU36D]|uniref:hypothetical protein n=1 Tax=Rhizobium sp. RU36D TaxID=1907415 RepID=UPI0009D8B869|nr:hypothetical protein [Rhizobium sp. RU36D]SMD13817.1 hypothetical protein SAMN05880593_12549 [Rhizobium sp. RU36D]
MRTLLLTIPVALCSGIGALASLPPFEELRRDIFPPAKTERPTTEFGPLCSPGTGDGRDVAVRLPAASSADGTIPGMDGLLPSSPGGTAPSSTMCHITSTKGPRLAPQVGRHDAIRLSEG